MKQSSCVVDGLRERKKARTREALLDAALDLFERKGFDATTIEDIAAAADVSPRTFFRYFDSKLDLVLARNEAKEDKLWPRVVARPPEETPFEAVRQVVRTSLVERLHDQSLAREFQVMMTSPTLRNLAREHFYEEEAELAHAFAARLGVDDDDLQAHVLAGAAASAIWTVVDRWIAEKADVDRLLAMLDDTFDLLDGCVMPAGSAASATPRRRRQPGAG